MKLILYKYNPIIYYQANNIANKELLDFSLFNTSSSGKKLYLVQNKLIKPNNRYSWQTEIQHNQYGTVIKQLSLDAEEEYFKAIVMDKDNNILANAELRI